MEKVGRCLDDLTNAHFCPRRQQKSSRHNLFMNPMDIESTLHIETLRLGSKGSALYLFSCILLAFHIYYVRIYSLPVYAQASPPDYCSGLGSAPPATAHVQNVLHWETNSKVRPKNISQIRANFFGRTFDLVRVQHVLRVRSSGWGGV